MTSLHSIQLLVPFRIFLRGGPCTSDQELILAVLIKTHAYSKKTAYCVDPQGTKNHQTSLCVRYVGNEPLGSSDVRIQNLETYMRGDEIRRKTSGG